MICSPSNHTSLSRLQAIQNDNCIGASGQEYSEQETADMILEKRTLQAERYFLDMVRAEFEQAEQDEIMETMQKNSDLVLANENCVIVIEGKSTKYSFYKHTVAAVSTKKNPYKFTSMNALPKRHSFPTRKAAIIWALSVLDYQKTYAQKRAEAKVKRLAEQKKAKEDLKAALKPGVILTDSWGYEQTNVEFYVAIAVKGSKVQVQELGHETVEKSEGSMSCDVMPGLPYGEIKTLTVGSYGLKVNSSVTLTLWDGKPKYKSWYY